MTVSGCTVDLSGMVTFNNLVVESGGEVILNPTSMTASYTDSGYDISASEAGVYTLNYLALKAGSTFSPSVGLQLVAVTVEIKRNIVFYADFADLKVGTLTMERGAEINVGGVGLSDAAVPATAHGTGLNGGAYASEGGVGENITIDQAATPYGSIYQTLLPGSNGGNGGKGAGYISIQADVFTLNGNLRANGGSSDTGGGGSGGSIYVNTLSLFRGFGLIESNGGDTTNSAAGGGSGGRIAVYTENDEFSSEGTYRAKGGESPATNGRGGPGSIYTGVGSGKNLVETLTVDNENEQLNFYLTLSESIHDITFDYLNAKSYAKLQMIEDEIQRTLDVKSVFGDGTGLIRIRANQIGTLDKSSADSLISKLQVNLELYNGGEFILSETTTILGKASTALDLDGVMTGVVNLILGPERHMRMGSNAKIVASSGSTSTARVSFGYLQLDPGSTLDFDENTGAEMLVGTLSVKYKSKITADYFDISCTTLNIELEGAMSAASPSRPDSESIDTDLGKAVGYGGAGHAGIGGGNSTSSGDSYGSIYRPDNPGSRPRDTGGRGGGKIHLQAGYLVYNDGEISVNGSDSDSGGGSGGSIWIQTYSYDGYGTYSACGGSSTGQYGAGSAGRIAIISTTQMMFEGIYLAFGGDADSPLNTGAAGSVYLEDKRKGVAYRRLQLDNAGRSIEKYSTIEEDSQTDFYFEELQLMNQASLHIRDTGTAVFTDVRQLIGDRSGLLHIHANQRYVAEYEEGVRQAFTSGINMIIDEEGEIILPTNTYVYGTGVTFSSYPEHRSVQIFGRITGVSNFICGFETVVYIGEKGHTAMLGDGTYTDKGKTYLKKDDDGKTTFGSVDLRALSGIKYAPDVPMLSSVGRIDCRYNSFISAESIFINTSTLNVEAGSEITVSATDRPLDTLDEMTGRGMDFVVNVSDVATGGGHGSAGGGIYDQTDKTVILEGGEYHGGLYTPLSRGSAGGDGLEEEGGKGGGVIELNVGTELYIDGEIKADGSNGESMTGGGSGGSIYIKSNDLEGHGKISVGGGDGGCGGSGGRISLNLDTEINFNGKYNPLGGSGQQGYMSDGGPGGVYIKDVRNSRTYEQLHLDNNKRTWDHYFILDEPGKTNYFFNDIYMFNNVSLQLKDGDSVSRELDVDKFYGDKTSRFHLKGNHIAYLEYVQSLTKTPINLWVDEGGTAYLSRLVYMLGIGEIAFRWNGEIIGTRHLRIVPGRMISIGQMARTSFVENGVKTEGVAGWFRFASLEEGAEAVMVLPPPMGLKLTVGTIVCILSST